MSKFKERLKSTREKLGLSQNELAEMAAIPASSVSHFENGNREPAFQTLIRLARCLHVTSDYLLGLDEWEKNIESRVNYLEQEFDRMKKKYFEPYKNVELVKHDS